MTSRLGSVREGCEGDARAEVLELANAAARDALAIAAGIVVDPEFQVSGVPREQVIGDLEDLAGDGDDRLFVAEVTGQAAVARAEGAAFLLVRSVGRLGQCLAQPFAALAGFAGAALSRLPEHRPAQLARWAASANWPMSAPISANRNRIAKRAGRNAQ